MCGNAGGLSAVGLFLCGVFAKLDESAAGRFRVEEGDVETFSALAGGLVDEGASLFGYFSECVGYSVLDSESDVLDAAAAAVFLDELRDGAFGRCAFEKLDFGLAYLEEGCADFLVLYFLDCETLQAESVFIKCDCSLEIGHCDAHMFDV